MEPSNGGTQRMAPWFHGDMTVAGLLKLILFDVDEVARLLFFEKKGKNKLAQSFVNIFVHCFPPVFFLRLANANTRETE